MSVTPIKGKKKDGLQLYRVRVNYTDSSGKRCQPERNVYGLAEAKLAEADMLSDRKPSCADMTVSDLVAIYLDVKKSEVRRTTLEKSERNMRVSVLPIIGEKRLSKLDKNALQRWKDEVLKQGKAIRTRQNYYKELHALLRFAYTRGYIPENPLDKIGNFKDDPNFETAEQKIRYYTADQFLLFISAARAYAEKKDTVTAWGFYVFFCIAFYTGMRKGEINALRWSDIDGTTIHVRRSVTQKLKGEDNVFTPPKNKSSYRVLTAPKPLADVLKAHQERQHTMAGYSDDWLVCGATEPLRDTSVEKKNIAFAAAANLPHRTIHEFRHSHASLLCNSGINIQEIARRLGHSDVQETWNTYSHMYPKEDERAVQVLDQIKM